MAQFKFGRQPAVCRGVKPEPMAIQICDIPHVVLTSIEPCGGIAGDVCLLKKQLQGERIPAADGYPIPESADSSLGVVWHVGPVGIVPPVILNVFRQIPVQSFCLLPLCHGVIDSFFSGLGGQSFRLLQQGETLLHGHPHSWGIRELCPVLTKGAKDIPAAYLLQCIADLIRVHSGVGHSDVQWLRAQMGLRCFYQLRDRVHCDPLPVCGVVPSLMGHIGDLAGQRPVFQFSSDIIGIFQFWMLANQFIIEIPKVNFRPLIPDHLGYLHGQWLAHL